jgi:hypothetical protein
MGANQNSDDDTISTIKKISMRQIQWHQRRLSTVIRVDQISHSNASDQPPTTFGNFSWYCWDLIEILFTVMMVS